MVDEYFKAEQFESIIFISFGLITIAVGFGVYIFYRSKFSLGFLISMSVLAIVQLVVGTSVYLRSPLDMERVNSYYEDSPEEIQSIEIPRMAEVMQNFEYYRWTELTVIVVAIILLIVGRRYRLLMGMGLGFLIQATIMLTLDLQAEKRGEIYLKHLIESTN